MSIDREEGAGPADRAPAGVSRREVLSGLAGLVAWTPLLRIDIGSAQATQPPPAAFPGGIELYQQAWENWAGDIHVEGLWTCVPKTADDVVTVVNWARSQGYSVRPRGSMHGWSPLTVLPGTAPDARVLLVDTTRHLTA
ncbi:MAG: cholesterol oxidase substrate-binding domain-containing protein, partial [Burkholderiales bacterium]